MAPMSRSLASLLLALAMVAGVVAPAAWRLGRPQPAFACLPPPSYLDDLVDRADTIVLADVVRAGDDVNRAPTLTPTLTLTATDTPTPEATATRTPLAATRSAIAKTPTAPADMQPPAEPPVTQPTWAGPSLAGIGATLRTDRSYLGGAAGDIEVDARVRSRVESDIREVQAAGGPRFDCEPTVGVARYQANTRVLALLALRDGQYGTVASFEVDAGETIAMNFGVRLSTYRRFFADLDATISPPEGEFEGSASFTAARLPLARIAAMVAGLRSGNDVRITPPETGSAGLAAAR